MWNGMNIWHMIMAFLKAMSVVALFVGEHIMPIIEDIAEGITIVLEFLINLVPTP